MSDTGRIPITIITGFLGSGKTTLILNLLPQLPRGYKLALLKNEFGDVAVDSQLASAQAISGQRELLNGCICCNLVGQLSEALEQLRIEVSPDRIVVETSGSAFPATLAMEVNRVAKETGNWVLDGVLSVIDVENWKGYEDTSYTAKVQAKYTDLIVLNKWEVAGERRLEDCEDRILDLELDPPIPRSRSKKGWVDKNLVFGLDAKLAQEAADATLANGSSHSHDNGHDNAHNHQSEVEVLSITLSSSSKAAVSLQDLQDLLEEAPKDEVYRIKAVLYATMHPRSSDPSQDTDRQAESGNRPARYILNWAFGRWTFSAAPATADTIEDGQREILRMTMITARQEADKWKRKIEDRGWIAAEGKKKAALIVNRVS